MTDDYEYFSKKRPDRVYLSKSLDNKSFRRNDEGAIEEITRPFRIISKVIDSEESHKFIKALLLIFVPLRVLRGLTFSDNSDRLKKRSL